MQSGEDTRTMPASMMSNGSSNAIAYVMCNEMRSMSMNFSVSPNVIANVICHANAMYSVQYKAM